MLLIVSPPAALYWALALLAQAGVPPLWAGVQGGGEISPGENFAGKISPLRKVAKFSPGEILA